MVWTGWLRLLRFAGLVCLGLSALSAEAALAAPKPTPTPTLTPGSFVDPTRKAFVVGVQRYQDPKIDQLQRSDTDAADVGADLEQVGFDHKNVTIVKDVAKKDDFNKKFQDFLATVNPGDTVFFFFSGHGVGVEASNENYLLLGGLRSLYAYTRDQMLPADKSNVNIINLKMASFDGPYETDEIAKNGISVTDIAAAIAAKKPKIAILVLDACRSLAPTDVNRNALKRGAATGSRMLAQKDLPASTVVIYSADFGEEAIESFGPSDKRRNSLFTESLRAEMQRPGQSITALAQRLRIVVKSFADKGGLAQEPVYYSSLNPDETFALVDGVGADRFPFVQGECDGSELDWAQISQHPQREELERHRRRYRTCPTAEKARRALVNILASAESPPSAPVKGKTVDPCDNLAAAPNDGARPPEVPGVDLAALVYDEAIPACNASIKANPRVPRFLFNLGRAEAAAANALSDSDPQRADHLLLAKANYSDAAAKGYVAALYSLATLYDYSDADENVREEARKDLREAAGQGFAPALYELGLREQNGTFGETRDPAAGYELIARAAETSLIPAMTDVGVALWYGRGVEPNPRRGVEWMMRAADTGDVSAMGWLGDFYGDGRNAYTNGQLDPAKSVDQDTGTALLWYGRAAAGAYSAAERVLGLRMGNSEGLPAAQPEIAERYFRLAANGGDENAEIELAKRLIAGKVLVKPENGSTEAIDLLNRALSHDSARAALELAKIYRNGLVGQGKDPKKALLYAFRAIELAVQTDPGTDDGDPFNELDAGIQLAEMGVAGQAQDANGKPLLTADEIDRLERFYGKVDRSTMHVKVRRLYAPLNCGGWTVSRDIWVWDWGRSEFPTEPQFRSLEAETQCNNNKILRDTLTASFFAARKAGVPFADLIAQQILAAKAEDNKPKTR